MTHQDIINKAKKGQLNPVYLFHGKEAYLQEVTLKIVVEQVIGSSKNSFNLETVEGKTSTLAMIVDIAQTLPLIGKKRVVIVKDAHEIKDFKNKDMLSYLENPSKSTCLIFTTKNPGKPKAGKKFYTALAKHGEIVEFKPLYDYQLSTWIVQRLKSYCIEMERKALNDFVSLIGNDLQLVDNELAKMAVYIGDRKKITQKDVDDVIKDTKINTVFQLTDAIAERNICNSLKHLNKLIEQGESPQVIIAMIARQIRLLLHTKVLMEKRCAEKEIIRKVKIQPFLLKKLKIQTKNFSIKKLKNCFYDTLKTDVSLKTVNSGNPRGSLEFLIMNLCAEKGM